MPSTRRSFLQTLAAGVPTLTTDRLDASPYRLGVETYCFRDVDLNATLEHVRSLGLAYLELHEGHLPHEASREQMASARTAMREARVSAIGVYIHDAFSEDERAARDIFQFARAAGFRYINGGPRREALPLLDRLSPVYGVDIAIHNHGPGSRYETLEDVTSVLENITG